MQLRCFLLLFLLLLPVSSVSAQMTIAAGGKPRYVIIRQAGASPAERYAVDELARTLKQLTGATFAVREVEGDSVPEEAIIVGPGACAARYFPEVRLAEFGAEQVAIQTRGKRLLLAGGRQRGTLYAVYRFLQDQCGVRWWTPWATTVPRKSDLKIGALAINEQPAFEMRDPFWFPAFDGEWAARNFTNGQNAGLTEAMGGKIIYKGFVHTFYPLVPPEKYYPTHPEWYSLINGKRVASNAQLCTTNPALRDFLVEQVRQWLKESPEARIVSISQNDCFGACECPNCKAIDDAEGSHAGTMITLVNYIASRLGPEFPDVAFDTLAYQYTRNAPKTVKPLPNVIVRLCSIECNFAAPLEDASNTAFASDLRAWSQKSDRLYIWDYTTNFGHYPLPHPNWYSLGPNVRFFQQHGVRGVFEQGAYQSNGGEMAELRAWVLARLLWNPKQDDRKLIREFLEGYYGKPAARYIGEYMQLMHTKATGFNLTCFSGLNTPFLDLPTLSKAERLWEQAEDAAKKNPDLLWRVRQGHLPVRYAFLQEWRMLRREALKTGTPWPLPLSRKVVADEWLAVATGPGPAGWSPMTHVNEGGLTPAAFVAGFATDPPEPTLAVLPKRIANPPAPTDIPGSRNGGVDGQDNLARLYNEGEFAELRGDTGASDGIAAWMPGSHHEWAFQLPVEKLPVRAQTGKWNVYAVVRVEKAGDAEDSVAFTAGVYDTGARSEAASMAVPVRDASTVYKSYRIGTVTTNKEQYIWLAPASNPAVKGVWIDRVYMVPAP